VLAGRKDKLPDASKRLLPHGALARCAARLRPIAWC
jgi:hypothetical protein